MSFVQINSKFPNYSFTASRQQSQPSINIKKKIVSEEAEEKSISKTNNEKFIKKSTLSTQTSSNSFVNTPSDISNDKPKKLYTLGHSASTLMFKSQQKNENLVQQLTDQLYSLKIQNELLKKNNEKDFQELKKENEKLKTDIIMKERIIILRDSEISQMKLKLQTPQVYIKLQQLEERINELIKENELLNDLLQKKPNLKENEQLKSEIQKQKDSNQANSQYYQKVISNLQSQLASIKPRTQSHTQNSENKNISPINKKFAI